MHLIGIDCAVNSKKCGLAFGTSLDGKVTVEDVITDMSEASLLKVTCQSIENNPATLLAIDAPLGWPISLEESLLGHKAGEEIAQDPNILFRRETDRFVKKHINKQPLDVGADRIARTAWAALRLLEKIRNHTRQKIPISWTPGSISVASCIEVYPAATLEARQISSVGYKGRGEEKAKKRLELLNKLQDILRIDENQQECMLNSDDAFDAALCLLAAHDFMQCSVFTPPDLSIAEREGWIWVRQPFETSEENQN